MMVSDKVVTGKGVPVYGIAAALVALISFVAWIAYANLAPREGTTSTGKLTPEGAAFDSWLKQKARESGGDASKLSPEDQQKLNAGTRGMGTIALKGVYEHNR